MNHVVNILSAVSSDLEFRFFLKQLIKYQTNNYKNNVSDPKLNF